MAVCSQIYTKHINTLCGQNVELLNVELSAIAQSVQRLATEHCTPEFGFRINSRKRNI